MRLLATTLVVALATAGVALPEVEARKPAASATVKKAKTHFRKGRDMQRTGQFEKAILEYQAAYQLAPRPELLFNIAQCHRLAGHASEAIDYYERFLAALPDDPAADEARIHVTTLKKQEQPAPPPARVEPVKESVTQKVVPPEPAPPRPRALPLPPVPAPAEVAHATQDRPNPPTMKWVGIGSVAAGAALVGTGAWFGWRASQTADELSHAEGTVTPALLAREQAALADERRFYYLSGGGGALVLLGAALWWFGSDDEVQARPAVDRASTGMVVRGRF